MSDVTGFEELKECNILWKIENFSLSKVQERSYIKSAIFMSKLMGNTAWRFVLLFCHCDRGHLSIDLERINRDAHLHSPEVVLFDVGLVNVLGATSQIQSSTFDLMKDAHITLWEFVEYNAVYGEDSYFLQDDVLTVKSRLWNYCDRHAMPEKLLLRSTLRMEKVEMRLAINPQVFIQSFNISSESVPDGYKLTCVRHKFDPTSYLEIPPPTIAIKPLSTNENWTYMTAKMTLKGRPRQPACRLKDCKHFGREFSTPWLLPHFRGPFDQYHYHHAESMDLDCEFTISNLEKEAVWERRYSDVYCNQLQLTCALLRSDLVNDVRPFLHDPTFADVQVQVGEVTFPAHRFVLSARSPIFRQLFTDADKAENVRRTNSIGTRIRSLVSRLGSHTEQLPSEPTPTTESLMLSKAVRKCGVSVSRTDGELSIVFSNVEERVVRKIVSFAYTVDVGCVDHDTVVQLLNASNRYLIRGLKDWCEAFLLFAITTENACRTLRAAHLQKCNTLKSRTLSFINENMNCVLCHLDSLSLDHEDRKTARLFGLVRGENWINPIVSVNKLVK